MQHSLTTLFLVLLALIILSGFFSASETGMMSINRYRLRHLVRKNNKQAIRVSQLLAKPERLLSVILIGNTLANIIASTVATLIGQYLYGTAGVAIATLLLSLVILIFAETFPKTLAALRPQQIAFFAALPLKILQTILAPLVRLISVITKGIIWLIGVKFEGQREALTGEELRSVVHDAGQLIPAEHKTMLLGLLDLEQATVEDIMIPKSEIVGINLEQSWHEIADQLETAKHTRLPLYHDSIDQLAGIIHVRDILNLVLEERLNKESLLKAAEPPYFIPEETPLNSQLLNFQKEKKRSCFVVDEYGDLQGLVTMEDILEEVVGEFTTDITTLSKDIIMQEDGSALIDASITLRHLKRVLGWQLPAIGPRTLSGLIIEFLGYIPPADCCLVIDIYQIQILKVSDNMIKTVKMQKK
ncbi:HlyC/CorC family transporter [Legionella dresdenensis]|uniref:HlyC/CorC family transporter n=1 Tax=Legionella dresdenensis TaxID=450200 RepID=A0ABV8CET1_9GAMM